MTLQELEYFYDLAQTLNFSVTAERLYVTQPVVSKHIRLLEESLGFPLIDRSIRKKIRQHWSCIFWQISELPSIPAGMPG